MQIMTEKAKIKAFDSLIRKANAFERQLDLTYYALENADVEVDKLIDTVDEFRILFSAAKRLFYAANDTSYNRRSS